MKDNRNFLGSEPIGVLLRRLALPTVVAQIINMLYNIVDRIYIGHIPGEGPLALTGVGVCMPIIMVVTAFSAFAAAGGAPRASIFMGKGDRESAEKTLGNCLTLQIIISVILTVALLVSSRALLLRFGASENTISYATGYMNLYALGTVFVQVTLGMNAFITTQGFAKEGMFSVLIGALANILLDPVFIFLFHMGVRGAALATVVSQALSCLWVCTFLCGESTHLKIKKEYMKLQNGIVLPCLALGLATFTMQASESVISFCFNSSLERYGGDIAVGAMTILTSVMQFAMLPLQGLGQGAQPIISYNYGARNTERVKAAFRLLLKCDLCYSVILWLLVMVFPQVFVSLFTAAPTLIAYAKPALRIYLACLGLFGIQLACQMTFTSLGKALASIVVAVVRKIVLLIPFIYLMPRLFPENPVVAVFFAEPAADFLAIVFTSILFAVLFKKVLKKMQQE